MPFLPSNNFLLAHHTLSSSHTHAYALYVPYLNILFPCMPLFSVLYTAWETDKDEQTEQEQVPFQDSHPKFGLVGFVED